MKKKNKKVWLISGVFDIIHVGHIYHLKEAKKYCDKLYVSLTSNKFVNKGNDRPVFNLKERKIILESISEVDKVIINNNPNNVKNILKIKPDLYIKGKDYKDLNHKENKALKNEINAIKKVGGKFLTTTSKVHSTSKILNENFNFLDHNIKNFIKKKLNPLSLQRKLKNNLFKENKNIHLLLGEPIIDIYKYVKVLGKSQKSNVISTSMINEKKYKGGIFLPTKFFSNFFKNNISMLFLSKNEKMNFNKRYFKNLKIFNINSNLIKTIKKIRFIDAYSNTRLFQYNINENECRPDKDDLNKYYLKLKQIIKKNIDVTVFDYGYGYFEDQTLKLINNNFKKMNINCQSNSSNHGFNLISKYIGAKILCVDELEFRLFVQDKNKNIYELLLNNIKKISKYKTFIVTMGSNGCYIVNKNKIFYVPTIIKTSKDTTGCGDIFFSAYIYFDSLKCFDHFETGFLSHIAAGLHAENDGNENIISKELFFKTFDRILKWR